MVYCTKCLNVNTRPRITFDENGVCNACNWAKEKETHAWKRERKELERLCDKFRREGTWDVIVPYSGGKDSVYVAYQLKELNMHPLLITLEPHLETEVGRINREKLRKEFDCITITPEYEKYRSLAIKGFKEQGRPKLPFVTGISTAVLQMAVKLDIPFIMYGEEGESEYGGASDAKMKIDRDYLVKYYYSGHEPKYGTWWTLPEEIDKLYPTHWSKFESWDTKKHADFAIAKGMQTYSQVGTFTDYAQLSDILQDLHAYLMFVKFGFGRCTSDVCIEIRAGRMTREDAVNLVRDKDGAFPINYLSQYLDYFKMTEQDFWKTIESFVDKKILRPQAPRVKPWVLKKQIGTPSLESLGKVCE